MSIFKLCIVIIFLNGNKPLEASSTNNFENESINGNIVESKPKQIDISVPPGYHPYVVVFKKKPSTPNRRLANFPRDFSSNGSFLSSGTILSRRWVLTRAIPIAYYPIENYTVAIKRFMKVSLEFEFKTYEVDFVLLHPDHDPGDPRTDAAMVRTSQDMKFDFETGNVNLGFNEIPAPLENCKVVTWNIIAKTGKKKVLVGKNDVTAKVETCKNEDYFICLKLEQQPCGINSGAPLLCSSVLVGIYVGKETGVVCEDKKNPASREYAALRIDTGPIREWIKYVLSTPLLFKDKKTNGDRLVLKTCQNSGYKNCNFNIIYIIPIVIKYFA